MKYEDYQNEVSEKAFGDELDKDELLSSLKTYISNYEQSGDIEYRKGMAYRFAGIMASDLFRDSLSQDAQIAEALELCGRLEIDSQPESADWEQLKSVVS